MHLEHKLGVAVAIDVATGGVAHQRIGLDLVIDLDQVQNLAAAEHAGRAPLRMPLSIDQEALTALAEAHLVVGGGGAT